MKVALYARVSTKDKDQNPETQLRQLEKYCSEKGWEIIEKYIDYESGRKSSRPALNKLKQDAIRRRFESVLVWKMDRFSRAGIKELFYALDFLNKCNICVISLTEPFLSTDGP
ncbi:MAG: recombinase family protein, partial [Candidatus Thermoplasmatota archaeon]